MYLSDKKIFNKMCNNGPIGNIGCPFEKLKNCKMQSNVHIGKIDK